MYAMKDIQVICEEGAAELVKLLFGQKVRGEELAGLAGALDGAMVNVTVRRSKGWLYLAVNDPARFEVYETSIRRDENGDLYGYIHEVRVAVGQGGRGLGARAFLRQVLAARKLGLTRFELFAAGDAADTSSNGYYTWARFGFNALLRESERKILPPELRSAVNLNQLMRLGGWRW